MRRLASLSVTAALLLTALVGTSSSASAATPTTPTLTVGSWDVNLRPWSANRQQAVDDVIAGTKLDVLALQGVWTQAAADAITNDPRIKAAYPYAHYAPDNQQFGYCSLDLPRSEVEDFITSIIVSGVDPRTALQPVAGSVDPNTGYLALGIAFRGQQLCIETLLSLLQEVPADGNPYDVIDRAYFSGGVKYAQGGRSGLLVLSTRPLQDVQDVGYDSFLEYTTTTYATVAGTKLAFAVWPRNVFEDVEPGAGFLQPGAQQPQLARDAINAGADLVIGQVSSGPGYQREAYDLLRSNGLRPLVDGSTSCPTATHAAYALCTDKGVFPAPVNIQTDNIFTKDPNTARCFDAKTFATTPVSDHVGIQVTCGSWKVDGFRAPVDMGGVYNTVKGGSTVPLKFTVTRGSTPLTSVADIGARLTATPFTCSAGVPTDDVEQVVTGGTALRYDASSQQFVQNWQTPKSPGACYKVTLTTADGTATAALFKLK